MPGRVLPRPSSQKKTKQNKTKKKRRTAQQIGEVGWGHNWPAIGEPCVRLCFLSKYNALLVPGPVNLKYGEPGPLLCFCRGCFPFARPPSRFSLTLPFCCCRCCGRGCGRARVSGLGWGLGLGSGSVSFTVRTAASCAAWREVWYLRHYDESPDCAPHVSIKWQATNSRAH